MKRKHNISKEGYMPEGFYPYSIYDEDLGEKAGRGSIVPATQGCIAAPSTSTKNKFYSEKKLRAEHKRIPQCYALLTMGGLVDTLQYTEDLQPVTDYHEAMMDNIAKMHEGEPVWTFRRLPKSQRKIDMQAFEYVQKIREAYGVDKKDKYYRQKLEEIAEENLKDLEAHLALKILALDETDKKWFKGYLPAEMYSTIKKQAEKSLDSADKRYFSKGGKDLQIRKKALDYMVAELKK